jgi:protein subunit release factor A
MERLMTDIDFEEINPQDLRIDIYSDVRNINGEGHALIRITHLPTNIIVEYNEEVTFYKNKMRSIEILKEKLRERK